MLGGSEGSAPLRSTAFQFRIDEAIQVSIQHGLRIADFMIRPMILDPIVIDDIRADLRTPATIDLATGGVIKFSLTSFLFQLLQFGLENLHDLPSILPLIPESGGDDHDARGFVNQSNSGSDLVHILSAWS